MTERGAHFRERIDELKKKNLRARRSNVERFWNTALRERALTLKTRRSGRTKHSKKCIIETLGGAPVCNL